MSTAAMEGYKMNGGRSSGDMVRVRADGFKVKDPWSALTHFIGAVASTTALPFLLTQVRGRGASPGVTAAFLIFDLCMICLYTASTCYHAFNFSDAVNLKLKKFDHLSIFLLIAGSYTPVCVTVLAGRRGNILLAAVWGVAAAGMVIKFLWVTCPRWFSSVLYIMMGWACLTSIPTLWHNMTHSGFFLLLFGGIFYTIGGVIYALKCPKFNAKHPDFGTHEIFHVFVMAGSLMHFMMAYYCLV